MTRKPKPRTYRAHLIKIGKIRDTLTPFLNLRKHKTRIKGAATEEEINWAHSEFYDEWFESEVAEFLGEYEYDYYRQN